MTGVDWSSLVRHLIRLRSSVTRCRRCCNSCAGFVIGVDGSSLVRHLIFRFASALTPDTFGVNVAERRHRSRICYEAARYPAANRWSGFDSKTIRGVGSVGRWHLSPPLRLMCLGKEVDRGGSIIMERHSSLTSRHSAAAANTANLIPCGKITPNACEQSNESNHRINQSRICRKAIFTCMCRGLPSTTSSVYQWHYLLPYLRTDIKPHANNTASTQPQVTGRFEPAVGHVRGAGGGGGKEACWKEN